jgi:hypothetical protein
MPLACGDGVDYPAGTRPDREKADLEARFCDPALREPFIAALAGSSGSEWRRDDPPALLWP